MPLVLRVNLQGLHKKTRSGINLILMRATSMHFKHHKFI